MILKEQMRKQKFDKQFEKIDDREQLPSQEFHYHSNQNQYNFSFKFIGLLIGIIIILSFLVSVVTNYLFFDNNLMIKESINLDKKQFPDKLKDNNGDSSSTDLQVSKRSKQIKVTQQQKSQSIKLTKKIQQLLTRVKQNQQVTSQLKAQLDYFKSHNPKEQNAQQETILASQQKNTSLSTKDKVRQHHNPKEQNASQATILASQQKNTSLSTKDKVRQYNNPKEQNAQQETILASQQKNTSLSTKYKVRQHPRDFIPKSLPNQDFYDINTPIKKQVDLFVKKHNLYKKSQIRGIKRSTWQRAIRLMQVVHNVNFKGQIQMDHFKFYPSAQAKYKTLKKLLKDEYDYYNQKYQIGKYNKNQIGICVSLMVYNSVKSKIYLRSLDSIFQQAYDNYHVVIFNDASKDGAKEYLQKYMDGNNIPADKYTIINNQINMRAVHNTYMAGHKYCRLGQIMTYPDGDDALIGRQVFSFLNAYYQRQKCVITYGQFLRSNLQKTQLQLGHVHAIPNKTLKEGIIRKQKKFYASHLKSMYVDVFRSIPQSYFHFDNGTWYCCSFDLVFMVPAIELAGQRVKFTNQLLYEYNGAHSRIYEQQTVRIHSYSQPSLKRLQDFKFADNPKTKPISKRYDIW